MNLPLESDQVTYTQLQDSGLSTINIKDLIKDSTGTTFQLKKSVECGNIFTYAQFYGRTYYISFIMTRTFFRCLIRPRFWRKTGKS